MGDMWGFPKFTFLGVPTPRARICWVLYWGGLLIFLEAQPRDEVKVEMLS